MNANIDQVKRKVQGRQRFAKYYNKNKGNSEFLAMRNAQRRVSRQNCKERQRHVLIPAPGTTARPADVLGFTERVSSRTTDVLSKLTDLQNNAVSTYQSTYNSTLQLEELSTNAPIAGAPSSIDNAEKEMDERIGEKKRKAQFAEERSEKRAKVSPEPFLQSIIQKVERPAKHSKTNNLKSNMCSMQSYCKTVSAMGNEKKKEVTVEQQVRHVAQTRSNLAVV